MIKDYDKFVEHLRQTGRIKLLPRILKELQEGEARAAKLSPRTETAKENHSLISGERTIQDGILVDTTGKQALLTIYQNVTKH